MTSFKKEVFRKTLHIIVLAFTAFWFYMYDEWWRSVHVIAVVLVVIYPILKFLSRYKILSRIFNARKAGEFSDSFAALMIMYIMVASVCWGIFGERLLGIAAIYAWGPGDAAAALIGMKFGKHKIGREKKKSFEGSLAMFIFSFFSVLTVLFIYGKYGILATIIVALIVAIVSTITELVVENGYDTFYCPISAMVVLIIAELILR